MLLGIVACTAYFAHNLIKDPHHNIVVCGIPKNGISSVRKFLNDRCKLGICGSCSHARCAEFKKNPIWNLNNQKLVVMFRDPYTRFLSAYNDISFNPYIRNEISKYRNVQNITFSDFTSIVQHHWNKISQNEHFTPQTTLCQPKRENYSFIGILGRASDEHQFWYKLLNASQEMHIHKAKANSTQYYLNYTSVILSKLYRNDYDFLRRTRLLD